MRTSGFLAIRSDMRSPPLPQCQCQSVVSFLLDHLHPSSPLPPQRPSLPLRSTRHIFLDLPQLSPQLQEYITTTSQLGGWSSNCVQVIGEARVVLRGGVWGSGNL